MKRTVIAAAMSLCMVSLAARASADTLVMRDGTRIQGTVEGIAARTITFRHADGVTRRYSTSRVEALEFLSAERANARAVSGGSLEAPAGTALLVRTVETIDSRNVGADQTFSALVERDVSNAAGRLIVPEASSVQLIVRQISSGDATGSPEMVLDIQSITVAGRRYLVSTADTTRESAPDIGRNRRPAETGASGAVIGTITGAVVGGGKGVAIGTSIGAPGTTGAQVLTRGRDIRVPSETALEFRLDRPVTLQPER